MVDGLLRRKVRAAWRRVRGAPLERGVAVLLFVAIVAFALWSRELSVPAVLVPLVPLIAAAAWAVAEWRRARVRTSRTLASAWLVLALAGVAALLTTWHLQQVSTSWEEVVAEREADLAERLTEAMSVRVADARRAAREAALAAQRDTSEALFVRLESIRQEYALEALATIDAAGELVAWAGEHRGPLPERVRAPIAPPGGVYYVQRPLYSYLYVLAPHEEADPLEAVPGEGGLRAIAAVLLEEALPGGGGEGGVAGAFERRTGSRPTFGTGSSHESAWQLEAARVDVVHASFVPLTQAGYRERAARSGLRIVAPLLLLGLLVLWAAWERKVSGRWRRAVPVLTVLVMLALLPLGSILSLQRPFSPGLFLLPGPGDWTLGRVLTLLAPLTAWVAAAGVGWRGGRRAGGGAAWAEAAVRAAPAALILPLVLILFRAGAGPALFEDARLLWFLYQPTAVLSIALLLFLLLPAPGRARAPRVPTEAVPPWPAEAVPTTTAAAGGRGDAVDSWLLAAGLLTALLLATALELIDPAQPRLAASNVWLAAVWAIPFAMCVRALRGYSGRASRLLRVLVAAFVAASAVLPITRTQALSARLAALEREVATLGSRIDPYLEFLVRQFANEIVLRDAAGERGVSLVYRAWVASGLAEEAYSPRITVWGPDGIPEVELTPGTPTGDVPRMLLPPDYLRPVLGMARVLGHAVFESPESAPEVQQAAAVPLADERIATVVVPMRRSLNRPSVLEPLLRERQALDARLTLLPGARGIVAPRSGVLWFRSQDGWRGEVEVRYPEATYHGHIEVRTPPPPVRLARGVLLLALDVLLVILLWSAGRIVRLDPPRPVEGWRVWIGSYRARVTAALFVFFLVPTVVFGAVAYRALAGEVVRAARLVAERSARRAVDAFGSDDVRGDLPTLSEAVGADVLYYHRGELLQASTPEALDLGLYAAWMPHWVYLTLRTGEELEVVDVSTLGDRDYLVAYRALPASGTLAVPAWPAAGMASTQQTELAHLMLFAALMGGLLSLALSVAVGQALAGPIARLRRAVSAVGGGNLRVRLPERRPDEFGQLYQSFNRMIEQLRQARSQEVRTARVLAWGEMARQVAHEIKNPLTPIRLAVQHVRRAHEDRRPDFEQILDSNVEQVLKEIDRLSEIARVFARYGAPAEAAGPLERVRLDTLLGDVARLYASGDPSIRFQTDLEPNLPDVLSRADELKEVMINLLENAREALDDGGEISLSARDTHDGYAAIEVRDDGSGIPADLLPRIFEPSFSSRSSGTGLGLAIVRRLVDSWNGGLSVDSTPGGGTTVIVRVPLAPDTRRASEGGS